MADKTERGWVISKFISVEIICSMLVTIFLVGGSWSSQSQAVKAAEQKIDDQAKKQAAADATVATMAIDIAVVKTQLDNQSDDLKSQRQDIKQILNLLQGMNYSLVTEEHPGERDSIGKHSDRSIH